MQRARGLKDAPGEAARALADGLLILEQCSAGGALCAGGTPVLESAAVPICKARQEHLMRRIAQA